MPLKAVQYRLMQCSATNAVFVQAAARREVLEETGLEVDVTTLLMVECASGSWFRFVVTGNVTGASQRRLLVIIVIGYEHVY